MGEGLLTRAKMTQRQLHYQSPSQHRRQPPKLSRCTAYRQLSRLENVPSRCLSWCKPLPDTWAGICFFQAVDLASESLLLSFLPSGRNSQLFMITMTGCGLVNLVSFRDFLKLLLSRSPSFLRCCLRDRMFQSWRKLLHNNWW